MIENNVLHGFHILPGYKFSSPREENFPSGQFSALASLGQRNLPLESVLPSAGKFVSWKKVEPM